MAGPDGRGLARRDGQRPSAAATIALAGSGLALARLGRGPLAGSPCNTERINARMSENEGQLCGTFPPVEPSTQDPSRLRHDPRGGRTADLRRCRIASAEFRESGRSLNSLLWPTQYAEHFSHAPSKPHQRHRMLVALVAPIQHCDHCCKQPDKSEGQHTLVLCWYCGPQQEHHDSAPAGKR